MYNQYRSPPAGSSDAKDIAARWKERKRLPLKLASAWRSKGLTADQNNPEEVALYRQNARDRNWAYKTWRETGESNDELDFIADRERARIVELRRANAAVLGGTSVEVTKNTIESSTQAWQNARNDRIF